jgi:NhaA family Na+:H+ antiporter
MATDIAFALGVLALAGRRAPLGLKVFLAAVAIVDDLGAVLVIALFYSGKLDTGALAAVAAIMALLVVLNILHVRRPWIYLLVGVALWLAVLKSGIHATIAGVLLALVIPNTRRIDESQFLEFCRTQLRRLQRGVRDDDTPDELTYDQQSVVESLEDACEAVQTPLRRLEHALAPWVAFLIMPVFALSNAGVALKSSDANLLSLLADPIKIGVLLGLVIGKPVGVMAFSWAAVRLGIASLPAGVGWRSLFGTCLLCGIGFTMALFIAGLAFPTPELLDAAKIGVLAGSLIAGLAGLAWIFGPASRQPAAEPVGEAAPTA